MIWCNKLISRPLLIFINMWSANSFVYILSYRLPIGLQRKPWLTDHNCDADNTKLEGFGPNGLLCIYNSIEILKLLYNISS